MNIYKIALTAVAALLIVAGCKKKASFIKSEKGDYEYCFVENQDGNSPVEGDMVVFDFRMFKGQKELSSSFKSGQPAEVTLPAKAEANVFYDPIYLMSPGDSLILRMVIDTSNIELLGPSFAVGDTFQLHFRMKSIVPKAEADARRAQEDAKRQMYRDFRMAVEADTSKIKSRAKGLEKELSARLADYKAGKLDGQIQKTGTGLKYMVHTEGTGPLAKKNDVAFVYYLGMLPATGNKFDSAFDRGIPFDFPVGNGRVIPGWDEALQLLKEGTSATLFIPAELAYGDRPAGDIPPNSELAFYIEVCKVIQ